MRVTRVDGDKRQIPLDLPPTYKHRSDRSDWVTPPDIIERARKAMGTIDLDPATTARVNKATVKASRIFTKKDNGLKQEWRGNVWLNCPFGKMQWPNAAGDLVEWSSQAVWMQVASLEWNYKHPKSMCTLFNAATSQVWFRPLYSHMLCFPDSRISFLHPETFDEIHGNQYASVIACWTRSSAVRRRFYRLFSEIGTVVYQPDTAEKWSTAA